MQSRLSIVDIAREAGVSPATVSRVLNGTARVSRDKAQRVHQAVAKNDFILNTHSRRALPHARAVGVLVPTLDEFYGTLVTAIEKRLRGQDVQMMCSLALEDLEQERALETFRLQRLDGFILLADDLSDDSLLSLREAGQPFVLLNRSLPELADVCLRLDNVQAAYRATRHLLELGHTRIAHISGPLSRIDARERYLGYHHALREAGLAPDPALEVLSKEVWAQEEQGGRAAVERLLKRTEFTAVFATNDWLAVGALEGLREAGVSVPGEVSVLGFDNRAFTRSTQPALTVMDFPRQRMGELAADHLLERIHGREAPALPLLEAELVLRGSTAPAPSRASRSPGSKRNP